MNVRRLARSSAPGFGYERLEPTPMNQAGSSASRINARRLLQNTFLLPFVPVNPRHRPRDKVVNSTHCAAPHLQLGTELVAG
jgi:hypothetical protein